MRRMLLAAVFTAMLSPALNAQAPHAGQNTPLQPGPNVNAAGGIADPHDPAALVKADLNLQRQNETVVAASTRNPDHILAAANDYRFVDFPEDQFFGGTQNFLSRLIARLFARPAPRASLRAAAAVGAWTGVYRSCDRGRTWIGSAVPGGPLDFSDASNGSALKRLTEQAEGQGGHAETTDPVLVAGPGGRMHLVVLGFVRFAGGAVGDSRMYYVSYTDRNNREGGSCFNYDFMREVDSAAAYAPPAPLNADGPFIDKPAIAVDKDGTLYVAYTVFSDTVKSRIVVARSSDGGATWKKTIPLLNQGFLRNHGAALAVDPLNGSVYLAWRMFFESWPLMVVSRSFDRGRTFLPATPISHFWPARGVDKIIQQLKAARLQPFDQFSAGQDDPVDLRRQTATARSLAFPTIVAGVVNGRSKLFAAWTERADMTPGSASFGQPSPTGSPRIMLSMSDNGVSWTPRRAIDAGPRRENLFQIGVGEMLTRPSGPQVQPVLTMSGTVNSQLLLMYYESRDELDPVSQSISGLERILDVRALRIDPKSGDPLAPSVQVSQYPVLANASPAALPDTAPDHRMANRQNLTMYSGGLAAFFGDYAHLSPSRPFEFNGRDWTWTSEASPSLAIWTDNRDVAFPLNENGVVDISRDWRHYTPIVPTDPPLDPSAPRPDCTLVASRNSNPYFTEIGGIIAGAPQSFKPLTIQRAFATYIENRTPADRFFRLTIQDNEAQGIDGSFDQFDFGAGSDVRNVKIFGNSSHHRTIWVQPRPQGPTASLSMLVQETTTLGGPLKAAGYVARVVLNPDPNNDALTTVPPTAPAFVGDTTITADSSELHNPQISTPQISTFRVSAPQISSPQISTPQISTPQISTPQISTPQISTPQISSPQISTPQISTAPPDEGNGTDVTYTVTNQGTTWTTYEALFNVPGVKDLIGSGNYQFQVLITRTSLVPAFVATATGCAAAAQTEVQVIANIPVPQISSPQISTISNPQISTPQISTPQIATFSLAPAGGVEGENSFTRPGSTARALSLAVAANDDSHSTVLRDEVKVTLRAIAQRPRAEILANGGTLFEPRRVVVRVESESTNVVRGIIDPDGTQPTDVRLLTPTVSVTGGTFTFDGNPHPATGFAFGVDGLHDVLSPALTFSYVGTGATVYGPTATAPTAIGTYSAIGSFAGNLNYSPGTGSAVIIISAGADFLVNTGPGANTDAGGLTIVSSGPQRVGQSVGAQFTIGSSAFDSVQLWMRQSFAGSVAVVIRADEGGLPGQIAFFKTYELSTGFQPAPSWVEFPDYRPTLLAGTYWLCFEPVAGSGFGAVAPTGAVTPLLKYAFINDLGRQWFSAPPNFGVRILGTLLQNEPVAIRTVTTTANDGVGSLREAILDANGTPGVREEIRFNIPGPGPHTIGLSAALPAITDPVFVNGASQPGYAGTPVIEITGAALEVSSNGLTLNAGGSIIRGLAINAFQGSGIFIDSGGDNTIEGNFIGTNAAGSTARANLQNGIRVLNSPNNRIGGTSARARNVLSGNGGTGLFIDGEAARGNLAQGNFIGTNVDGTAAIPNTGGQGGVTIENASHNTIGGTVAGAGNIVSGNRQHAITVFGTEAADNVVQGNFIGTDPTGMQRVPNGGIGVDVVGAANTIIGGVRGARNVISGNQTGIQVRTSAAGTLIQNNYVGVNAAGTGAVANDEGILIQDSTTNNVIGGPIQGAGNVISGNRTFAIRLNARADANVVDGNHIGTDLTGALPIPNGEGLTVAASSGNRIGGTIGNVIRHNERIGIRIESGTGNLVSRNSIGFNGQLGIDLDPPGANQNDPGDGDVGPNDLQNYPDLTSIATGEVTQVQGALNSTPLTQFAVEVFRNTACDPFGFGEGESFLGSVLVTTDAEGRATFGATFGATEASDVITATATNTVTKSTSEFSNCARGAAQVVFTVTTTADGGPGSLRQALSDAATSGIVGAEIRFNIPGEGPHTIGVNSVLPSLTSGLFINGASQPGYRGVPLIVVRKSGTVSGFAGLSFGPAGTGRIRGLSIVGFETGISTLVGTIAVGFNVIDGNYIGVLPDGITPVGNVTGIDINTSHNTIGGTTIDARNVVSGNTGIGIVIRGSDNVVEGNFIGTDPSGIVRIANAAHGVNIVAGSRNRVGGAGGARNVISGNDIGIFITGGTSTVVQNNFIGVNAAGSTALPNAFGGIALVSTTHNVIGGATTGSGNVISGNPFGIYLPDGADFNEIDGNLIGTDSTGTSPVPNRGFGIQVVSSSGNTIGGGIGNVIKHNLDTGVIIGGGSGNRITNNSIGSNGALGIDIVPPGGVNPNDSGDGDQGANDLQNYPVIESVDAGQATRVRGSLTSTPLTGFALEVFRNTACDPSGFGEGESFLGSVLVTTNEAGLATFDATFGPATASDFITATATNATTKSTSEFSACVPATAVTTLAVTTTANAGAGSLRQAILDANATPDVRDEIGFNIPGAGPHTIDLTEALPALTGPAFINGGSQPGYAGVPLVVLTAGRGALGTGLTLSATGNSRVRGLSIVSFRTAGIDALGGSNNVIDGNYIGVLPDGTSIGPNVIGISIAGADNRVGGTTADARNVISGNDGGILIQGAGATGNVVQGNYIGVGPDGTTAVPNRGGSAILVNGGSNNTIGGNIIGAGNVVSGNLSDGITVSGSSALGNVIQANLVGTDRTGLIRVPNRNIGISVVGAVNTAIGGIGLGRNVVSGNVIGIQVRASATGTVIENNYIGVDAAASAALSNRWGVQIVDSANGNTVGGISPGAGNVISGNTTTGIEIAQNSQTNLIQGNLIGTDPSGNTAIPNGIPGVPTGGGIGVHVHGGASGNTIGGSAPGAGNLISGNQPGIGVFVEEDAPSNVIAGNRVGTNAAGTTAVPNGTGIRVASANNTIGGTISSARNLVSGNSGFFDAAIMIVGPSATGNVIQGNFVGTDVSGTGSIPNFGNQGTILITAEASSNTIGGTVAGARNVVSGNTKDAITICCTARANTVQGNFIGTDPTGMLRVGNGGTGIDISFGAPDNVIGGAGAARNIISGNGTGIMLHDNSSTVGGTLVHNNYIGVDATGSAALSNGVGLSIILSGGHVIGGPGLGNVISGNAGLGIVLNSTSGNRIEGNWIGTDRSGTAAIANGAAGIRLIGSGSNTIGGSNAAARNYISGNRGHGIDLRDNSSFNVVSGNYVGVNGAGTAALGNASSGVQISDASDNRIGGVTPADANIIGGNSTGVAVQGVSERNHVTGNLIGVGADCCTAASALVPNGLGVIISGSQFNFQNSVGVDVASGAGRGNVISANTLSGVRLADGASQNAISGNWIGTDPTGTLLLPNGANGLEFDGSTLNVAQFNTIKFNAQAGIRVLSATNNRLDGNSISFNGTLGIDLGPIGVTPNDDGDGDFGANNLQNFPVITAVTAFSAATRIVGTLNSTPVTAFSLTFYANSSCDASGHGEGQIVIGTATATTDASGNASFDTFVPETVAAGGIVTATATDPDRNTSEFSACQSESGWQPFTPPGTAAEVTTTNPRSGNGSLEFVGDINNAALVFEPGATLGTYSQLNALSFEWAIDPDSQGALPPHLALRVYPPGDPRSFFLFWDVCNAANRCALRPKGVWTTTSLIGQLSIQGAGTVPPPASLDQIPPDAPIVGLHIRGGFDSGLPTFSYVDNVTVGFTGSAPTVFTFELADRAISRHRPSIAWSAPAAIAGGAPLSADQLNATASTPGTFRYIPAPGTLLPADAHALLARFTAADTSRFLPVSRLVSQTVTGLRAVLPDDPLWFAFQPTPSAFAAITGANPRSGTGSLELTKGDGQASAYLHEFRDRQFGTVAELSSLSFDWFIDPASSSQLPPHVALRVYPFGDPRSFFLFWDVCSEVTPCTPHETGVWQNSDVIGRLRIQRAEDNPPPASLADIPPDAPIVGIHIRGDFGFGGPWHGFADNMTIGFAGREPIVFNFEK